MMTVWLSAGRAAPGANSGTVRVLAIARVAELVVSSAKFSFGQLAGHAGGALVEPGQPGDVVGDDADRDEIHGDLLVSGNVLIPR